MVAPALSVCPLVINAHHSDQLDTVYQPFVYGDSSIVHSTRVVCSFCLLTCRGLWDILYCLLIFFSKDMFALFMASFTLLFKYNMGSSSQTFSLVWNRIPGFSLLISTLPIMCLFIDGGLGMAFQILFYSLREQEKSKVRETLVEAARVFGKNPGHSTRHVSSSDSFGSLIQKTTHFDSPSCSMAYEDSQTNHPDLNFLKLKIIHEKFQDFTDPLSSFNTAS